jgi:GTP-binding protein HflX
MSEGRQRRRLTATVTDLEVKRQKAFLVGVVLPTIDNTWAERSLDELALLTDTAGSEPVESVLIRRESPKPATFIGKGQARELAKRAEALDIDVLVFDNDLTSTQQRNLQKIFQVDVVDRTAVILDIFAQHATSKEGMLQVELALLQYHLPRLRGRGIEMSRIAGGIGTKGPGETKLETDSRKIRDRIARLRRELKELEKSRGTKAKSRRNAGLPLVALVGYTNAGKSSLMNRMTHAGVLQKDQLFSTLSSTIRKLNLPKGSSALLSDTVGFVQRLPHQLIEAFRSTLEEIAEADLILHIVDGSDPSSETQMRAVRTVLGGIEGAAEIPEVIVFNKSDLCDEVALKRLTNLHPGALVTSAETNQGIDVLLARIESAIDRHTVLVDLVVPYDRGDLLASLHEDGRVVKMETADEGIAVQARIRPSRLHKYQDNGLIAVGDDPVITDS